MRRKIKIKIMKFDDFSKFYLLLFATLVVLFMFRSFESIVVSMIKSDEDNYIYHANLILKPELYSSCMLDPQFCNIYPPKKLGPFHVWMYTDHPPLFKYFMAGMLYFWPSIFAGRFAILIVDLATILIVIRFSWLIYDKLSSMLSAIILLLSFLMNEYVPFIYHDHLLMFLLVLCCYFYYKGINEGKAYLLYLGGLFGGLAILTKEIGILIVPSLIYLIINSRRNPQSKKLKKFWKHGLISLIILFATGIVIYNLSTYYLYKKFAFVEHIRYFRVREYTVRDTVIEMLLSMPSLCHTTVPLYPILTLSIAILWYTQKIENRFLVITFLLLFLGIFPTRNTGRFERFLLYALPFSSIITARGIVLLGSLLSSRYNKAFLSLNVLMITFLLFQLYTGTSNPQPELTLDEFEMLVHELSRILPPKTAIFTNWYFSSLSNYLGLPSHHLAVEMSRNFIAKYSKIWKFEHYAVVLRKEDLVRYFHLIQELKTGCEVKKIEYKTTHLIIYICEDKISKYPKNQSGIESPEISSKLHFNLGVAHANRGEIKAAIEEYKKALELNPEYEKAYFNLANCYQQLGMINEAIMAYKKFLKYCPDNKYLLYQKVARSYIHAHEKVG